MVPAMARPQQQTWQSIRARFTWRRGCNAEAKAALQPAGMCLPAHAAAAAALQRRAACAAAMHAFALQQRWHGVAKSRGSRRFASLDASFHRSQRRSPAVRRAGKLQHPQRKHKHTRTQQQPQQPHSPVPQHPPPAPFTGNAERMQRPASFAPALLHAADVDFFGTNHRQERPDDDAGDLFAFEDGQVSPACSTSSSSTAAGGAAQEIDYFSSNHTQAYLDDGADSGLFEEQQQQPATPCGNSGSARR